VIKWRKKHDGIGMETTLEAILKYANSPSTYAIEVSASDKTVKLGIPHGELFHRCDDEEWRRLLDFLDVTPPS